MPAVRIEGGITVMEHGGDALDRAPRVRIDSRPLASMGGADERFDLTHVESVVLLPDGRVATFAGIGNRLLIFGSDGRGERVIGRTGKAPGEFMAPHGMILLRGDTMFLADLANRRLNWIRPDDGVVASRPLDDANLDYFASPAGALPGGMVVVHSAGLVQDGVPDSIVRPPATIALLDPASGASRVIATIPDLEIAMVETRYRGRRRLGTEVVRFGLRAHVVVWDSLIASASAPAYEIETRRSDGAIVSRLRVSRPRRPVTSAMRERSIARELERFGGSGGEGMVDPAESRRLTREAPYADSLPPLARLYATSGGLLWALDAYVPGDTAWSATAFRRDGAVVATLHAPGAALPIAFGDDRVVLLTQDDDDVVSLRVHRLVRR